MFCLRKSIHICLLFILFFAQFLFAVEETEEKYNVEIRNLSNNTDFRKCVYIDGDNELSIRSTKSCLKPLKARFNVKSNENAVKFRLKRDWKVGDNAVLDYKFGSCSKIQLEAHIGSDKGVYFDVLKGFKKTFRNMAPLPIKLDYFIVLHEDYISIENRIGKIRAKSVKCQPFEKVGEDEKKIEFEQKVVVGEPNVKLQFAFSISVLPSTSAAVLSTTKSPIPSQPAPILSSSNGPATTVPSSINPATTIPSSIGLATTVPNPTNLASTVPSSIGLETTLPSSIDPAATTSIDPTANELNGTAQAEIKDEDETNDKGLNKLVIYIIVGVIVLFILICIVVVIIISCCKRCKKGRKDKDSGRKSKKEKKRNKQLANDEANPQLKNVGQLERHEPAAFGHREMQHAPHTKPKHNKRPNPFEANDQVLHKPMDEIPVVTAAAPSPPQKSKAREFWTDLGQEIFMFDVDMALNDNSKK